VRRRRCNRSLEEVTSAAGVDAEVPKGVQPGKFGARRGAREVIVMKLPGRPLTCLLALALAVLPAGCERRDQRGAEELKAIGHAYHKFLGRHGRGPREPEQLKELLGDNSGVYRGLKGGRYELVWYVRSSDLINQGRFSMEDRVLGWGKDVPDKGGPVLLRDFSVKTMTAQEFKKAPKIVATYDEPPPREW
jgi:hypothetical protein